MQEEEEIPTGDGMMGKKGPEYQRLLFPNALTKGCSVTVCLMKYLIQASLPQKLRLRGTGQNQGNLSNGQGPAQSHGLCGEEKQLTWEIRAIPWEQKQLNMYHFWGRKKNFPPTFISSSGWCSNQTDMVLTDER